MPAQGSLPVVEPEIVAYADGVSSVDRILVTVEPHRSSSNGAPVQCVLQQRNRHVRDCYTHVVRAAQAS